MDAPRAALALTAAVLALALTACGGSGTPRHPGASGGSPSPSASGTSAPAPAPDPGYQVPRVGQCSAMTGRQSLSSVAAPSSRVSCRRSHTTVVTFVGYSKQPLTAATPLAKRRTLGRKLCEPAYRAYAGGTAADRATSILTWTLFVPDQGQLLRGARWVRCDVLARSGNALVPLPRTKPYLRSGVPEALRLCETAQGTEVSCARPHVYRLEHVFLGTGRRYPGTTAYAARGRCHDLMGGYGGYVQYPSRQGWSEGDRFVRCLGPLPPTPSPTPTP